MKKHIFIFISALMPCICAAQDGFPPLVPALVLSVHDGDGCVVMLNGKRERIRFVGVDAPEIGGGWIAKTQPYGRKSGDALREKIKGDTILLDTLPLRGGNRDAYGRMVAEPYTKDTASICFWLVETGGAWAVRANKRRYPRFNTVLISEMQAARAAKKGLWLSFVGEGGKVEPIHTPSYWRRRYSIR